MLSERMVWRASCTEQFSGKKNITGLQNLLHYKFKETCDFFPCAVSKRGLEDLSGKALPPAIPEECEYLDYKGVRTEPQVLSIFLTAHHRLQFDRFGQSARVFVTVTGAVILRKDAGLFC